MKKHQFEILDFLLKSFTSLLDMQCQFNTTQKHITNTLQYFFSTNINDNDIKI